MNDLKPLRVFIPKDKERECYWLADDLMHKSSRALCFTFIEPVLGRWLIPSMCGFGDVALFIETHNANDVAQFWKQIKSQELCAVYVPTKEKDSPQPSIMLFRNKYCERLTPSYVYNATPEQLIPSVWAGGPQNIGTLEV